MRSGPHGARTSAPEIANVSAHGFWILVDDRELFLPFAEFPWFRDASIRQLSTIERPHADHLRWPELDIDLSLDAIEHPERYPLVARSS